jgi:ribosomal protein S18 acetylase RimI-like enzyme
VARYARFICLEYGPEADPSNACRWLAIPRDIALLNEYWRGSGGPALGDEEWGQIARDGYQYAAILDGGRIVAIAAVWKRSAGEWELAAVSTREGFRRRGLATAVCSFVTAYILAEGRHATCTTRLDNAPMIATALKLGYCRIEDAHTCECAARASGRADDDA